MDFLFEKLDVYSKTLEFVKIILAICEGMTKNDQFLSDQLKKAALSISLNIAEGNGRKHIRDRHHFFIIARGSCFECVPILQLLSDKGIMAKSEHMVLRAKIKSIGRMLTGLSKS